MSKNDEGMRSQDALEQLSEVHQKRVRGSTLQGTLGSRTSAFVVALAIVVIGATGAAGAAVGIRVGRSQRPTIPSLINHHNVPETTEQSAKLRDYVATQMTDFASPLSKDAKKFVYGRLRTSEPSDEVWVSDLSDTQMLTWTAKDGVHRVDKGVYEQLNYLYGDQYGSVVAQETHDVRFSAGHGMDHISQYQDASKKWSTPKPMTAS